MTGESADGGAAILVEGASDRAAVLTAAELLGIDLDRDGVRVRRRGAPTDQRPAVPQEEWTGRIVKG